MGGKDNDLLWGEIGNDTLVGGEGNDTFYGGTKDPNNLDFQGRDLVFGGSGNDLLYGNEGEDSLSGGEGNDTFYGGKNNDIVQGDSGDDLLFGDEGNDTICSDEGNDTIYGGTGNNTLCGGEGNDIMFGDRGDDLIAGGEGADTFRFQYFLQPGESAVSVAGGQNGNPFGLDTLTDFTPAQDQIQLDRRVLPVLQPGTLPANLFSVTNNFNVNNQGATPAQIIYDKTSGLVYYNPLGTVGNEVTLMQLQPNLNISSNDFDIV